MLESFAGGVIGASALAIQSAGSYHHYSIEFVKAVYRSFLELYSVGGTKMMLDAQWSKHLRRWRLGGPALIAAMAALTQRRSTGRRFSCQRAGANATGGRQTRRKRSGTSTA